MVTLLS